MRQLQLRATSFLFQAVVEATEEEAYYSLCMATTMQGYLRHVVATLPLDQVRILLEAYNLKSQ